MRRVLVPVAVLVGLALVPKLSLDLPYVFNGPVSSPGTLQLLALCLVFAGVALTYDLLFGFTGLLSFGHALYFATGVYVADVAMTKWHWDLGPSLALTAGVGLLLPLVLGAVSLRVAWIAFAMVTLAFAQAGSILVGKNPDGLTGGEEGLGLDFHKLPEWMVGVLNTKNLYWLALGYAAVVFVVARWAVESSPGRVWQAIRENELRVEVLGLRPFPFKLGAFVPLLVMVVIGGTGTTWGAMLGGVLYTYLDHRLGALADSGTVQDLPSVLKTPLSEPLFILGTLFILLVFFLPGGLAALGKGGRPRALRRIERALRQKPAGEGVA